VTKASEFGPVSAYVRNRVIDLLDEHRVLVWYDPEGAFSDFINQLALQECVIVSTVDSRLRARRVAEAVYRRLNEGDGSPEARNNLLIYISTARGATPEERQQDPFEGFARCGVIFGDQEGEHLPSLAQLALPDRAEEIARLFLEGRPTLALLDTLPSSAQYPLVRQVLGVESPVEVVVAALSVANSAEKLERIPGALAELGRLIQTEFGLSPNPPESWPSMRNRLATYLLVSELAFDLPNGLPEALATVPHAEPTYRQRIFDVCDRLRESDAGREVYIQLASQVERDLRLPSLLKQTPSLGSRDTFSCQEHLRLQGLVRTAADGDLASARSLLAADARSVWRRDPERTLLWQVVQRCVTFLDLAAHAQSYTPANDSRSLVEAYVTADGLWKLDRAQRLYEYAVAQCAHDDSVEPLVQRCRFLYRAVVQRVQTAFQTAVQREGWPPEGMRRQTQTFDSHVTPELALRHKIAYFLVDSLRYEMGRDLSEALQDLGSIDIEGVVTVLPTTTSCGMAALMPGADGAFAFVEHHGELIPTVGGRPLPGVNERKALLADRYGDRYLDCTLEDLLSMSLKTLGKRIGQADLLIVRTQDIDALGEGPSLYRARRVMSEVTSELRTAAIRLASIGFQTLVFAADHGHMLVPEILAGDVLTVPTGTWLLRTRRSLLGQSQANPPGMLYLQAQQMGIVGPFMEYVAAMDFKMFRHDAGYFHEGLSLQECVVPVVTAHLSMAQMVTGDEQVAITYRSDRVTSSVVGLKVRLMSLFTPLLSIRLEAFDGPGPKAQSVGQAGDCDARDPITGEIKLQSGVETQVPLIIDPDFQGSRVEVRAIDPRTGAVLARLSLKNARMN
jgi:hypothetical protein